MCRDGEKIHAKSWQEGSEKGKNKKRGFLLENLLIDCAVYYRAPGNTGDALSHAGCWFLYGISSVSVSPLKKRYAVNWSIPPSMSLWLQSQNLSLFLEFYKLSLFYFPFLPLNLKKINKEKAELTSVQCVVTKTIMVWTTSCPPLYRTHTGERPYKCQHPGCGKAFTQLSNLQSHSRSHMTDKPFRCNSCYKCFADEQSLREHIPKHSETKHLKTHICHVCGKSYTQETYLTRHMAKHSFDGRNPPPKLPSSAHATASQTPLSPPHQHPPESPIDVKPLDALSPGASAIPHVGTTSDSSKPSSAFMPLAHQYPSPSMINSSVPSSFPFPSPRIPGSASLTSRLPHLPSVSTTGYFPFDSLSQFPPKREAMDRGPMGMGVGRDFLSLQQIKNFSNHQSMFSKSEPSSPVHKDGFSWLDCYPRWNHQ